MAAAKHNFITTPDGGKLSCYTLGSGPSLLVLHGTVCFALTHRELAEALSEHFTVHLASRRGRGHSTDYPPSVNEVVIEPADDEPPLAVGSKSYPRAYGRLFSHRVLAAEVEDLKALVQATAAEAILAVSSGALIAMHALLSAPTAALATVRRVILFEPPLLCQDVDTPCNVDGIKRFEQELAGGDLPNAMVTSMRVAQLGPGWIPRGVMRWLSSMMMAAQEREAEKKKAAGEDAGVCTMKGLAPLTRCDFAIVEAMVGDSKRLEALGRRAELLLLSGSRTPAYLAEAMRLLGERNPGATQVVIEGSGHELLCNKEMRGNPAKAVPAIKSFLGVD
jgi:pimeloyl-ACP methyl ester carboxylesterase